MADVFYVHVERLGGVVRRLEDRQCPWAQVRADPVASVEGEQKAEIGAVRLEQRQSSEIVSTVSGDDSQPGVQQVVRFFEGCRRERQSPSVLRQSAAAARVDP